MITAISTSKNYITRVTNGSRAFTADTTKEKGGAEEGFRPHELLEAAVASCLNISIRMAAEQENIRCRETIVTVQLDRSQPNNPIFTYHIEFDDAISEHEKKRLLSVVDECPVKKTLSGKLSFSLG